MKLIERYIFKEFSVYFLSCFFSIFFIATAFFVLAELGTLNKEDGVDLFIRNILQSIPLLIEIIMPISILLASILTFIILSKNSEIVAMVASGVSYFGLLKPLLFAGIFLCLFSYFNQSYLAPWWGADSKLNIVSGESKNHVWRYYRDKLFYFKNPVLKSQNVEESRIFSFYPESNSLHEINELDSLKFVDNRWIAKSNNRFDLRQNEVEFDDSSYLSFKRNEFPVIFIKELVYPKYSSFLSIFRDIQIKKRSGIDYHEDQFGVYQKISSLISIYVMFILALPFSLFSSRSDNVKTGIVISIILGLLFWLVDQSLVSLNGVGFVTMEISAFGANFIFVVIAFALLFMKLGRA